MFQKLSVFSSSICCHCSKWVLFIYTCSNVQLKSFVYECHTCITIIHCETVMGKMVFKANLHIHKSKISCMKTKLLLPFFVFRIKKSSKKLQSKVLKMHNFLLERVTHVDDNETAQWILYICFRKCLQKESYTVRLYYWSTTLLHYIHRMLIVHLNNSADLFRMLIYWGMEMYEMIFFFHT